MDKKYFYVLYSSTSKNCHASLRPSVMWTFDTSIIDAAEHELCQVGETIETMAGIHYFENENGMFQPERELTHDERLDLSIQKLGDDGRMFVAFSTDAIGAAEFIESAKRFGIDDDARRIVVQQCNRPDRIIIDDDARRIVVDFSNEL